MRNKSFLVAILTTAVMGGQAWAHSTAESSGGHGAMPMMQEQYAWGMMGDPDAVDRVIDVSMTDNMRFTPDRVVVKLGETVRFAVDNDGQILHEFVIGTQNELKQHAQMMAKFPNMAHDEPYMAHVESTQKGEVVWLFNEPGQFEYACLLPGHFEAGMKGVIEVVQ